MSATATLPLRGLRISLNDTTSTVQCECSVGDSVCVCVTVSVTVAVEVTCTTVVTSPRLGNCNLYGGKLFFNYY